MFIVELLELLLFLFAHVEAQYTEYNIYRGQRFIKILYCFQYSQVLKWQSKTDSTMGKRFVRVQTSPTPRRNDIAMPCHVVCCNWQGSSLSLLCFTSKTVCLWHAVPPATYLICSELHKNNICILPSINSEGFHILPHFYLKLQHYLHRNALHSHFP